MKRSLGFLAAILVAFVSFQGADAAVRKAVGEPLKLAVEYAKAGDAANAYAKIRQAESFAPLNADEIKTINQLKGYLRAKTGMIDDPVQGVIADPAQQAKMTAVAARNNLSDAFYNNTAGGISYYSSFKPAKVVFADVGFNNGVYAVTWKEMPLAYQTKQKRRVAEADKNFTWDNWNAMSQDSPYSNQWTITCLFDASQGQALSRIPPKSEKLVQAKIKSANGQTLVFDCKF